MRASSLTLNLYRTFSAACFTTSICIYFHILPYHWFLFQHQLIFKIPPEIWRFFTSFLLTSSGLGIVMDTYFVYQYMGQIETAHPKFNRREDVLWYLIFCSFVIIVSLTSYVYLLLPPSTHYFFRTSSICPDSEYLYCYHGS